jgi:membrane-associated phospholipid phosphatase
MSQQFPEIEEEAELEEQIEAALESGASEENPPVPLGKPVITRRNRGLWLVVMALGLGLFLVLLPRPALLSLIRNLAAQTGVVILALSFGAISLSLLFTAGQRLDARIFLFVNLRGARPKWLDWIMWVFTQGGNGLLALSAAAFFYLGGERLLGILMLLGVLSLWLVVELIKFVIDRGRPYMKLEETRLVGMRTRGRSFPSGHTSQAFFLASVVLHYFDLGAAASIGLYGLAALVGFTRIYMGVHYPRDVLAGAVLGEVWGLLSMLATPYL